MASPTTAFVSFLTMDNFDLAQKCLWSLIEKCGHDFNYVLSSNAPGDEKTVKLFYDVRDKIGEDRCVIIINKQNIGYIGGHNNAFKVGIKKWPSIEVFIAVNDDLEVREERWGDKILGQLGDPQVAIAGLSMPDTCNSLDENFSGYLRPGKPPEYIEGSFLGIRTEVVKKMGLFDDHGLDFCYCEDSDLSLRVRHKGYKISTQIIDATHLRATTSRKVLREGKIDLRGIEIRNRLRMQNRWARYLKTRSTDANILVIRERELGDVICIEPVIQRLQESIPGAQIHVQTKYYQVFDNHPHVVYASPNILDRNHTEFMATINLDGVYEKSPDINLVAAYLRHISAPVTTGVIPRPKIFLSAKEREYAQAVLPDGKKYVGFHADTVPVWKGRNVDIDCMRLAHDHIKSLGYTTVMVGQHAHLAEHLRPDINLVQRTDIRQLMAVVSRLSYFIGIDSGPFHIAQSFGIPTVAIFGCVLPHTRVIDPTITMVVNRKDLQCLGCHTFAGTTRTITNNCPRGNEECTNIEPSKIVEAFEKLRKSHG